jgi:hypothetical protein
MQWVLPISDYYDGSVTMGLASGRPSRVPSPRNVLERRRLPIHPLQCPRWASAIAQGVPWAKVEPMARDGVGLPMCYRRVCGSTPGDWDSHNPVLALSLRRCRTTAYTSSAAPRFTNMLLSPRPFGSRLVVRLGVMSPELRPPLVAIPSVRDTAHAFTALGLTPSVLLRGQTAPRSVPSHFSNSTGVHLWTACAFAGYLCSSLSKG